MKKLKLVVVERTVYATNREVAERFCKVPKYVNEAIRKLMVENSTVKSMFFESTYISSIG